MAEEIQEAVQIIRVGYEGIEIAMRIGSGGLGLAKRAIEVLVGMLEHEKTLGKTNMRKLLMKGGDLQVFQYKDEEAKKVEKLLKKYGVLYSVLPNINKKNGMSEIIFHAEAVPRMNMIAKKLTYGKIGNFDEYVQEGDEKEIGKLLRFLKGQKAGNVFSRADESPVNEQVESLIQRVGRLVTQKESISAEEIKEDLNLAPEQAEAVIEKLETLGVVDKKDEKGQRRVLMDTEGFEKRMEGYQNLLERIAVASNTERENVFDITIDKSLVREETETLVKMKVPGTWGNREQYLWVEKEHLLEINAGKTFLTFLEPEKEYPLYDKENKEVGKKKGKDLYTDHYDKVEAEVRKRYEESRKKPAEKKKAPQKAGKRKRG